MTRNLVVASAITSLLLVPHGTNNHETAVTAPRIVSKTIKPTTHVFTHPRVSRGLTIVSNRSYAKLQTARYGWSTEQYKCLVTLWTNESHWNHRARNTHTGAYGIPQALPASKMQSAGKDWRTNPHTQIKWGMNYIRHRYKSPCLALMHWRLHGWY